VNDTVANNLAGHFRFSTTGVIEFAAGYDDAILPRSIVSAAVATSVSRGWLHASATGERVLEVTACNCGAPRPPGLGPGRGGTRNRKPDLPPVDPKPGASPDMRTPGGVPGKSG
jgi:hypothetical protein